MANLQLDMTSGILVLMCWSALAFVWWLVAVALVARGTRFRRQNLRERRPLTPALSPTGGEGVRRTGEGNVARFMAPTSDSGTEEISHVPARPDAGASLSVFKPIPPVQSEVDCVALAEALESFIAQLTYKDELLIGIDPQSQPAWLDIFARWKAAWPAARIKVIAQTAPSHRANSKVAWLEVLSVHAQGELWLWSDADVIAPPGLLQQMKQELASGNANAVTAAYAIRRVSRARNALDALFVNAEFLPGALLLGGRGQMDLAFGAATMFPAATFHDRVPWADLGAQLADDHELGQRLQPVQLSAVMVTTFTQPASWRNALEHYYRWQKTIRWCQPAGFAATVLIIPLLGWAVAFVIAPDNRLHLAGLVGQWLGEIATGALLCSLVGCHLPPRTWAGLVCWPVIRMFAWITAWLPLPVVWDRRRPSWFTPSQGQ